MLVLMIVAEAAFVNAARAYGPRGFDTVVIDAGHGGYDRGGGPGQAIPEKPYTLDAAIRLERELRRRGFRTVMTRTEDVFVPLPERVAIANSCRNAVFVSVHYNSAPREGAHGYETYYYRSDSFGLAERLHQAQLSSLNTEDRHVRRRGFYVIRRTNIPSVLCEGGFLTNPEESRAVLSPSYRQRWAENIADALAAQRREGDPGSSSYRSRITSSSPPATYGSSPEYGSAGYGSAAYPSSAPSGYGAPDEPVYSDEPPPSYSSRHSEHEDKREERSHRRSRASRGSRHHSRGSSRSHGTSRRSSRSHGSSSSTHHHHHHSR